MAPAGKGISLRLPESTCRNWTYKPVEEATVFGINFYKVGEVLGVVTVQEISDLTVTRNLAGTEKGVAVGAGGLLVHAALEVEQGGGLDEEAGKGAGSGIVDGVALVEAGAGVGQGG